MTDDDTCSEFKNIFDLHILRSFQEAFQPLIQLISCHGVANIYITVVTLPIEKEHMVIIRKSANLVHFLYDNAVLATELSSYLPNTLNTSGG